MTLNGEFLWDGVRKEEGRVNFAWKRNKDEAEDHMADVAALVKAASPDIVNMVEVENLKALKTFNTKFLSGQGYKAYLVNGRDSTTGQDVGLLTRIDPEGNRIARSDKKGKSGGVSKSVSKNYFAKLQVGGKKIALVGLHFLARPDDTSRKLPRQAACTR